MFSRSVTSPKLVGVSALLALLSAGAAFAYAADVLVIENGSIRVATNLDFGDRFAPLLTIWNSKFALGIQSATMYFRTDKNFAWFQGGGQDASTGQGELDAGGGQALMSLSSAPAAKKGTLDVNGTVTAKSIIVENGKIGIANANPQNLLQVGDGTSSISIDRVKAVIASNTPDAGIAIAQKNNVNVLVQASGAGGYVGTTSDHPLVLRTADRDRVAINKDGDVSMYGNVGIGRPDQKAALDVKGEIRGKLWASNEYAWSQYDKTATRMTRSDRTVCFLTYVSGLFYGWGEAVEIKEQDGYWILTGKSGQKDVGARARCIGAPDDSW